MKHHWSIEDIKIGQRFMCNEREHVIVQRDIRSEEDQDTYCLVDLGIGIITMYNRSKEEMVDILNRFPCIC